MAIAEATLKYLVREVGCPSLFVTHYPQLSELAADPSLCVKKKKEEEEEEERGKGRAQKVKAAHMAFLEGREEVEGGGGGGGKQMTFLYKLK